jgi:AraC-like DNA-binding protein
MLLGHLYIFLSLLIRNNRSTTSAIAKSGNRENHCKRAIEFISRNYSGDISIRDIASNMGLDRSYLYTIFMKTLNMSPQDFLIHYRLDRAVELMGKPELDIGDISRSVGYDDPLAFSRIFKKKKGVSPSLFRQELTP